MEEKDEREEILFVQIFYKPVNETEFGLPKKY